MHEVNYIWVDYFWASLKSNGPEALVQTVVYGALAYTFVPAVRKWVHHKFTILHDKMDSQHAERMAQAERHHEAHMKATKVVKSPVARKAPAKPPVAPKK